MVVAWHSDEVTQGWGNINKRIADYWVDYGLRLEEDGVDGVDLDVVKRLKELKDTKKQSKWYKGVQDYMRKKKEQCGKPAISTDNMEKIYSDPIGEIYANVEQRTATSKLWRMTGIPMLKKMIGGKGKKEQEVSVLTPDH